MRQFDMYGVVGREFSMPTLFGDVYVIFGNPPEKIIYQMNERGIYYFTWNALWPITVGGIMFFDKRNAVYYKMINNFND